MGIVYVVYRARQFLRQPPVRRHWHITPTATTRTVFPSLPRAALHRPLQRVEAAVPAVVVVDQPHRRVAHVLRGGQRRLVHYRVISRVHRDRRHADLVQPRLGPAHLVVVVLITEPVNRRDVRVVELADRGGLADVVDAELARVLYVL